MSDNKKKEMELLSDKLFMLYSLTTQHENTELANSQFNDITVKDLHLIHTISLDKNQTITQIAKKMSLTKGTLTSSIDKLENLGYVIRQRSVKDRRVINIELTKKGKLLYRLHNREHNEYIKVLTEGLNDQEKQDIDKALDRLIAYLEKSENK